MPRDPGSLNDQLSSTNPLSILASNSKATYRRTGFVADIKTLRNHVLLIGECKEAIDHIASELKNWSTNITQTEFIDKFRSLGIQFIISWNECVIEAVDTFI